MSAPKRLPEKQIQNLRIETNYLGADFESLTGYAVVVADFDGNILAFNEGARLIFGYSPEEMIGKESVQILHSCRFIDSGGLNDAIGRLTDAGRCSLEEPMVRHNGSEFPALITYVLVKGGQGETVGFMEIVEDLSERKRAEREIVDGRERLEYYLRNSPAVIYTCEIGGDWRTKFTTDNVKALTGFSAGEFSAQPRLWRDRLHREDVGNAFAQLERLPESGRQEMEYRWCHRDGHWMWMHDEIHSVSAERGRPIEAIGYWTDITRRKNAETELDGYRASLKRTVDERTVELQTKRRELVGKNKITSDFLRILEITSSSLNFDEAATKLLPLVSALTGSDYCLMFYADAKEKAIRPAAQYGLAPADQARFMSLIDELGDYGQRVPLPQDEPMFVSDVASFSLKIRKEFRSFLQSLKAASLLVIPIFFEGRIAAMTAAVYLNPKNWTGSEKEIVTRLMGHLQAFYASFRHTSDLLNKTMILNQHLQMIEAMSGIDRAILTSTSKEQVVYGAARLLGGALAGEVIEILEFDAAKGQLRLVAKCEHGKTRIGMRTAFDVRDVKCWSNVSFGSSAYLADTVREPDLEKYERRFAQRRYRSLLVVPLISQGDVLGALAVGSRQAAAFRPKHLEAAKRLGNQIAVALSNTGLIERLRETLIGAVNSLAAALDAKSPWTKGHSQRVGDYALKLGQALGFDNRQLYDLRLAALFHDVGKIGTYDVVLDKKGQLSDEEFALIKEHPGNTCKILTPIPGLETVAVAAKHHHEKYDGRGYPDGLVGEDIPLLSRIICVADTYDAMRSDRPYRKGLSATEARAEIERQAGTQFDPELAHLFVEITHEKGAFRERRRDGQSVE